MVVGDPSRFAIESGITVAYERLGFRALGFFVIHIGGRRYGVQAPEATLLACSLDQVKARIADRGIHTASFAGEPDAGRIADAYRDAVYAPEQENERYFGLAHDEFCGHFCSHQLVWAPDGDEAFDDGSFVLQFDVGDRVRLIGFRSIPQGYHHDPCTLSDVWLEADSFYGILGEWRNAFVAEWNRSQKIVESEDGAETKCGS